MVHCMNFTSMKAGGGGEGMEKDQMKDINLRIVERALDLELGDLRLNTLFHLYVL